MAPVSVLRSVDWGLSYYAPCRMQSWEAPKGINGGLD